MLPCEIHAIIVSSRVQMLVLASFFPMTEEENATVLIVCACDCDICVVCVCVVFVAFVWCVSVCVFGFCVV